MIAERLKTETRPHHDRMEGDPLSRTLLNPAVTVAEYTHALAIYHGFYAPLEAKLAAATDWAALGFDWAARRKTPLLERDLRALGVSALALAELPQCPDLPELPDLAHALGSMYVLEGATLGGQLMARHMQTHLGLSAEHGCAFFNSYGAALGPMWKGFKAFLEGQQFTPHDADAVIHAAGQTYDAMRGWFVTGYRLSNKFSAS